MIQLVATDLDDTLLNSDREITQHTVDVIRRVREQGCIVTVSTGRMYFCAKDYIQQLGVDVEAIAYNGAMVVNSLTGEVIVDERMDKELAKEILDIAYREGIYTQVYMNDECYCDHECERSVQYHVTTKANPIPVGDLREFLPGGVTKVLFLAEPEIINRLRAEAEERFGDRVEITISKPDFLEFVAGGVCKGNAVKRLAEKYNIPRENVMTFGDSFNDLSMIEYAGVGVAMGNAYDEIKAAAQVIAPTNDEDGVAYILEKMVLNQE